MTADDHPYRQPKPERRLASAAEVLRLIERGAVVQSLRVVEELDLGECWDGPPIRFVDCKLARLDILVGCAASVRFTECEIDEFFSMGGQYHDGLVIERCTIFGGTDLSCGGHNRADSPVVLTDTKFGGFVDFFDSIYEGPFALRRCSFAGGTNLLNQKILHPTRFKIAPLIEDNEGDLAAFEPRPND
jgi:hypothetical protein